MIVEWIAVVVKQNIVVDAVGKAAEAARMVVVVAAAGDSSCLDDAVAVWRFVRVIVEWIAVVVKQDIAVDAAGKAAEAARVVAVVVAAAGDNSCLDDAVAVWRFVRMIAEWIAVVVKQGIAVDAAGKVAKAARVVAVVVAAAGDSSCLAAGAFETFFNF